MVWYIKYELGSEYYTAAWPVVAKKTFSLFRVLNDIRQVISFLVSPFWPVLSFSRLACPFAPKGDFLWRTDCHPSRTGVLIEEHTLKLT